MSFATVQDLPAELLIVIFLVISDTLVDNGRAKAPPCMFISHVCGRWRAISLTIQQLWRTNLPRRSLEWTETCLSRCPSLPLKVALDKHYPDHEEAAALTMRHWDRIRELAIKPALCPVTLNTRELSEGSKSVLKAMLGFLTRPSDCLEELEFDFSLDLGLAYYVWLPVEMPQGLFSLQPLPRLWSLKLKRCRLAATPLPQLFVPSLRTLELVNILAWPDVNCMIEYLKAMPLLERFTYKYWQDEDMFDCSPSRSHQARCLHFPHLTDLNLDGFWLQNFTIFNYIAVPSQCRISFDYREWDHIDELPEAMVLGVIATSSKTLEQYFAPATSQGDFFSLVEISEYGVRARHRDSGLLPPDLWLYLPASDNPRIEQAILRLFLSQPVMTQTNRLVFNAIAWKKCPEVFDEYIAVRELCIMGHEDITSLTLALGSKGTSLFPGLKRIKLINMDFDNTRDEDLCNLAQALRDTHITEKFFEYLEFENCYQIAEDLENEIRALLGLDRVVLS